MIPKHWKLTYPILKICKDSKKTHRSELINILTDEFDLTEEGRNQLKPSDEWTLFKRKLFEYRVEWAIFDLKNAGLVNHGKGVVSITDDGKRILEQNLLQIDRKFLHTIPKYKEFNNKRIEKRKRLQQGLEQGEMIWESPEDRNPSQDIEFYDDMLKMYYMRKLLTLDPKIFQSLNWDDLE